MQKATFATILTVLLGGCQPPTTSPKAAPTTTITAPTRAGTGIADGGIAISPVPPGPVVRKLAAAPGHTCALLDSGEVACWGGSQGPRKRGYLTPLLRPQRIAKINDAIDVATGVYHTCVVHKAGTVTCWGSNSEGQFPGHERYVDYEGKLIEISAITDAIEIASRAAATCVRHRNGHVSCWGDNAPMSGASLSEKAAALHEIDGLNDAVQLASGYDRTCARRKTGRVVCWGRALPFKAKDGALDRFSDIEDAVDVTVDHARACVVRATGDIVCVDGMIAGTIEKLDASPRGVAPADSAVRMATGGGAECAVLRSGRVSCWGTNGRGELGDGTTTAHREAQLVVGLADAAQVVASWNHMCALRTNGAVACWGANNEGQLGIGSDDVERRPQVIAGLKAKRVSAGGATCAIDEGGQVLCWGHDITVAPYEMRAKPTPIAGLSGAFVDVVMSGQHGCAVAANGTVSCWGSRFALGETMPYRDIRTPAVVPNVTDAIAVVAGDQHTCALRQGGGVRCWGHNRDGELGDGTNLSSTTAVDVKGLVDAVELAAGEAHTCARRAKGEVVCWGRNDGGQLGQIGPRGAFVSTPFSKPVVAAGLHGPAAGIAAGRVHSCARSAEGRVRCWGHPYVGAMMCADPGGCFGDPYLELPVQDATIIDAGGLTTCVVNSAGAVSCIMKDLHEKPELTLVPGLKAKSISVASEHSCAITTDNAVACWGRNNAGEVSPDQPYRTTPVAPVW